MHAMFITFTSAAAEEELAAPFTQYAQALRDGGIPGFVSKTWLSAGETVAGFHLFDDAAAADRYLAEMFTPNVVGQPAFSDIRIERFEVNEAFSAMTNGIPIRRTVAAR